MHIFYEAYLERLEELHRGLRTTLDGLPQEALDWSPQPEINSLTVLIVHLTGAERYWIGDVVAGESSQRDREAEFRQTGWRAEMLVQRLDESLSYARRTLEGLSLADLERICTVKRDGRQVTAAWALLHALEHTALHLGHVQITRQLWEQR